MGAALRATPKVAVLVVVRIAGAITCGSSCSTKVTRTARLGTGQSFDWKAPKFVS